jgi:hypothetical protein
MKFEQRLIKYREIITTMKLSHRNLAMILIGVIVMSTSGVYSLTQSAQTQASSRTTEQPFVLGHIEVALKDPNGNIKAYRQTDNLVVSNGLNATINKLFGPTSGTTGFVQNTSVNGTAGTFNFVGVGTSASAVASTDTGLGGTGTTQRGNKVLGTVTTIRSGGGTGMGAQIAATWAAGKLANASSTSTTINEAGLFDAFANATSSSNMYAHQLISPGISMGTGDTLTVTWKITFSHS